MARNVEIKARLPDPQPVAAVVESISGGPGVVIEQEDVFFRCDSGRLKLRTFADGTGELIHYHRPDVSGPKTSDYVISKTRDPSGLRTVLERALGIVAVVRKTRRLFLAGRTRIHLDSVEGLGSFLELEVVLGEGESLSSGEREAARLMSRLGIERESLVSGAYADLLAQSTD
jgi:predicted adenylyl cyclase CyaB